MDEYASSRLSDDCPIAPTLPTRIVISASVASAGAQVVDGAQLMAGEGPCVEAWRTVAGGSQRATGLRPSRRGRRRGLGAGGVKG